MRRSAEAGPATASATTSAEKNRLLLTFAKCVSLFGRHIRRAPPAVNSRAAAEPPVGPHRADEHDLGERLPGEQADDHALRVCYIERGRLRVLEALEHALDRRRRANAVHAHAHHAARGFVPSVLAN